MSVQAHREYAHWTSSSQRLSATTSCFPDMLVMPELRYRIAQARMSACFLGMSRNVLQDTFAGQEKRDGYFG